MTPLALSIVVPVVALNAAALFFLLKQRAPTNVGASKAEPAFAPLLERVVGDETPIDPPSNPDPEVPRGLARLTSDLERWKRRSASPLLEEPKRTDGSSVLARSIRELLARDPTIGRSYRKAHEALRAAGHVATRIQVRDAMRSAGLLSTTATRAPRRSTARPIVAAAGRTLPEGWPEEAFRKAAARRGGQVARPLTLLGPEE